MSKLHNDKIFMLFIMLLTAVTMVMGQNIIDLVTVKADAPRQQIDLLPKPENEEAEKNSEMNILGFALMPEETVTVTADGTLSDMLVPDAEEKTDNTVTDIPHISSSPKILIYHTHTTEAYRLTDTCSYKKTSDYRTNENDKNIVAVGEELKKELEKYGYTVFHDITDHEPPKLATSYDRSVLTMQKYLEEQDIDIFIDVHRDAANEEKNKDDVVVINGERCARMMFVVGKGIKYDIKPDFDSNYALASQITDNLESITDNYTRPIRVKDGRYNQHISDTSLLVEIGHNANTLDETIASAKHLAWALNEAINA